MPKLSLYDKKEKIIRKTSIPLTFMENMENSIMSESSLKKDWLCKEEEEAWKDL